MKTKILVVVMLALLVLALAGGDLVQAKVIGQETCPQGNGWVKVDGLSGFTYTFTAIPEGYKVTDNCYKASTDVVYGSGATVTSGTKHELSHASFKLEVNPTEVTPTEVTPTEVTPTEVTPTEVTPTEVTPTEITPTEVTETPEPSETPTVTPTPKVKKYIVPVETPCFCGNYQKEGFVDGFTGFIMYYNRGLKLGFNNPQGYYAIMVSKEPFSTNGYAAEQAFGGLYVADVPKSVAMWEQFLTPGYWYPYEVCSCEMGDWFVNLDGEVFRRPCLFDSTVLKWLMDDKGMDYESAQGWVNTWYTSGSNILPE